MKTCCKHLCLSLIKVTLWKTCAFSCSQQLSSLLSVFLIAPNCLQTLDTHPVFLEFNFFLTSSKYFNQYNYGRSTMSHLGLATKTRNDIFCASLTNVHCCWPSPPNDSLRDALFISAPYRNFKKKSSSFFLIGSFDLLQWQHLPTSQSKWSRKLSNLSRQERSELLFELCPIHILLISQILVRRSFDNDRSNLPGNADQIR